MQPQRPFAPYFRLRHIYQNTLYWLLLLKAKSTVILKPNHTLPDPQPPRKLTGLKKRRPEKNTAGLAALQSSLQQVNKYMRLSDAPKVLMQLNQKGGIDCPGCAWPDPDDHRSALGEYCENGVKAIAEEATRLTIDAHFFTKNSVQDLAGLSDFELGKLGRLTEPMYLAKGDTHYRPVSWDAAFEKIADTLNELASPDEALFYTSGRTSNEAAFLYQLFVRMYGTNNLPDCSNMCHESSGKGLSQTLGIGKGSVTLQDFYEAELVLIMGQNPGTNHPRMLSALEKCKENGGKIISVNPLPEAGLMRFTNPQRPGKMLGGGTALSDLFLPIRINEDVALLKAWLCMLLREEDKNPDQVFDWDFIRQHCTDPDTLLTHLREQSIENLIQRTGLDAHLVREAFELILQKKKIIICWAMGLTQHKNAVDNIREIVNLLLFKGSIGKPGAGTCPVRGHSNVQGDRTMGIWEEPPAAFLDKLKEVFGFEPPRHHGHSVVDAIDAMLKGEAKVLFAMGGNFLSATPDTELTARALRNCHLTAHVSTKLNRSHLITGEEALILPCLGRTDKDVQGGKTQFVTVENSMGVVHMSRGTLDPCSPLLLSEPEIVARLAVKTLPQKQSVDWMGMIQDYDRIREKIEQVIPGFEDFNRRVRNPAGFYLPNGARQQQFNTSSEKAVFTVNQISDIQIKEGELIMMTIRSHDQYNTTIYGLDDRYRGILNERRVVLLHEKDMATMGLAEGEIVDLVSRYSEVERIAEQFIVLSYPIPQGCCATYFPEANVLIPYDQYAHTSKTPISKSVIISIRKR
jgi:molybdopterin-dependent oxidoreductase alpha subunit